MFDNIVLLAVAGPRSGLTDPLVWPAWDQGARSALSAAKNIYRFSLEGSGTGGIRVAQGGEQGANMCVRVLTNETSQKITLSVLEPIKGFLPN